MYEWESNLTPDSVKNRIHSLREESKRISNTTLRGNFANEEDRKYWVKKLNKVNSELSALEQMQSV